MDFFQVCGWAGELGKDIIFFHFLDPKKLLFSSNALTTTFKNCDFS